MPVPAPSLTPAELVDGLAIYLRTLNNSVVNAGTAVVDLSEAAENGADG